MRHHHHSASEKPVQLAGIAAIAAAIGAAVALLFTPRRGNEVRSGIRRRAEHLGDRAHRSNDDTQDIADNTKQRLQSTASKVVDDTKSTVRKAVDDAKETKNEAQEATDKAVRARRDSK